MHKLKVILKVIVVLAAGWTVSPDGAAQSAEDFPGRPVRFIVTAAPGAAQDLTVRIIAQKLSDAWGRQVVVDNRGGAAGAYAMELASKASPDGHTLLMASSSHAINMAVNPKWPYGEKDFAPVSLATTIFYVVFHTPAVPVKSVDGLIAYANANPGKLHYGSTGSGSLMHLGWELFGQMAGVRLVHVPYKGGAQVAAAALSGDVQVGFGTMVGLRAHLNAGRLRALAITAASRSPVLPDMPTLSEMGLPGYHLTQWYGVLTGAAVPASIIGKLNASVVGALKSQDVAQRLAADGSTPVGSSAGAFAAHLRAETARWSALAKSTRLALY